MNLDACDPCLQVNQLTRGERVELRIDDQRGEIHMCPRHRAELDRALEAFITVSRLVASSTKYQCEECGFNAASKDSLGKHRRRHQQATMREKEFAVAS